MDYFISVVNVLSREFGVIIGLIILLYGIQRLTSVVIKSHLKQPGYNALACVGVTCHELSHAFLCLVCGHRINNIVLFKADSSGTLGYVNHSYNPRNIYHQIGNFFIGIAPLFGGTLAIIIITVTCLPNGNDIVKYLFDSELELQMVGGLTSLLGLIEIKSNGLVEMFLSAYRANPFIFFVWLYLSSSISLHLSPSPVDLKGSMLGGALTLLVFVGLSLIISTDNLIPMIRSIVMPLSTILILCATLATGLSFVILAMSAGFKVSHLYIKSRAL
jgi:hypothetical protein